MKPRGGRTRGFGTRVRETRENSGKTIDKIKAGKFKFLYGGFGGFTKD